MSVSLTRGSSRETLSPEEVLQLRQQGSLVVDARRMRPRYFDGRSAKVIAAADLLRQVAGQARQVNVPRPDDTLAALAAAAAGR